MIDENIVYVKIKNGIFKCYKSEQIHKPIYYPVESKTNGYIDYYDVIRILNIDDLYEQVKKQKEVIDKAINNSQYWIDYYTRLNSDERIALRLQENIDILKEVE